MQLQIRSPFYHKMIKIERQALAMSLDEDRYFQSLLDNYFRELEQAEQSAPDLDNYDEDLVIFSYEKGEK